MTTAYNKKLSVAIAGVILYYIVSIGLSFAGFKSLPILMAGIPGLLVSIAVLAIAAFGFVSNIDAAVQCSKENLPKYMEWYLALGLILTVIWIYVEILSLLSRARQVEER